MSDKKKNNHLNEDENDNDIGFRDPGHHNDHNNSTNEEEVDDELPHPHNEDSDEEDTEEDDFDDEEQGWHTFDMDNLDESL